jgi:hypothetical protein
MLVELIVKSVELRCGRTRPIRPKQRSQLPAQVLVRTTHV